MTAAGLLLLAVAFWLTLFDADAKYNAARDRGDYPEAGQRLGCGCGWGLIIAAAMAALVWRM
jgi:hypothetical protein